MDERKGTWVDPILIDALERVGNAEALAAILKASTSQDAFTAKAALAALDRINARGR